MVSLRELDERLERARRWHRASHTAVAWDDVELAVRLDVSDESTASRILFADVALLVQQLASLRSVVATGAATDPGPSSQDAPPGPEGKTLDEPSDRSGGEPEVAAGDTPDPATITGHRLTQLRDWWSAERRGGASEGDITDVDLQAIAESAPATSREFKRFRGTIRKYSDALVEVLRGAEDSFVAPMPDADPPGSPVDREDVAPETTPEVERTGARSTGRPTPVVEAPATPPAEARAPLPGRGADDSRARGATAPVDMSHYDFNLHATSVDPIRRVHFDATNEESLVVSWDPPPDDGAEHIFTVVTSSEFLPTAPTVGTAIGSTYATQMIDTSYFDGPSRYVSVFCSSGRSEDEARRSQPTLWAQSGSVLPVRDCHVREDEGTVIGTWERVEGAVGFEVYRVPVGRGLELREEVDLEHRLGQPDADVTAFGFTDRNAIPGMTYEYRVYARATLNDSSGGGAKLSPPVARQLTLEARVEPIRDLGATVSAGNPSTFDLSWTPPRHPMARVEIYRTPEPPLTGLDRTAVDRSALDRAGLTQDLRVSRPGSLEGDRMVLREVPWPQDWPRAYFTPVTVLSEQLLHVGTWQSDVRNQPPTEVRLIERVDSEFLTFAWPLGSSSVHVYQSPPNSRLADPRSTPSVFQVSEDDYRRLGGAHLDHPLPAEGCSVHLVSVSYSKGRPRYSEPVTVQYAGLARLSYRFEEVREGRSRRDQASDSRRIVVRSESGPTLDLVLVHHPARLPLHAKDGRELARRSMSFTPGVDQIFIDPVPATGLTGFVRVFPDVPAQHAHRVALLDPPLRELRLGRPG